MRFSAATANYGEVPTDGAVSSITIADNTGKNTAGWNVWSQLGSFDQQCMPAASGTAISGFPSFPNPSTMSPNGSNPIGLMFWLDKTKPDPKPARLKYTFYDNKIHGTVTQQNSGVDTGEYRVLIQPSDSTWSEKVQLIGTQGSYDSDGIDMMQFGIYYRLRDC